MAPVNQRAKSDAREVLLMTPPRLLLLLSCLVALPACSAEAVDPPAATAPPQAIAASAEHADRLTPGLRWAVEHGLRMRVVEPKPIVAPLAYRKATEMHAGKVELAADGRSIEGYIAGQPFPDIDPADPQAANKIMWNVELNFRATDDIAALNVEMDTGKIEPHKLMQVERHYVIGAYRRLSYVGRLYVDPKPALPNPDGVQFKESFHPFVEPSEMKRWGFISNRYSSPDRPDESWPFMPSLRHVRRMNVAQRSDAIFGSDIDVDSFWGFNAKLSAMRFRLLGEQTVLLPMHGENSPVRWQSPETWLFDDVWEPRRAWVVEAVSTLPMYAYGKRVLYIDKESYLVAASDIYDRTGKLWKVWLGLYRFAKEGRPGAKLARYDEEMPLLQAMVMIDTQLSRATKMAVPSPNRPDDEGWLINMGAKAGTTEEFFTISHMVGAGG